MKQIFCNIDETAQSFDKFCEKTAIKPSGAIVSFSKGDLTGKFYKATNGKFYEEKAQNGINQLFQFDSEKEYIQILNHVIQMSIEEDRP